MGDLTRHSTGTRREASSYSRARHTGAHLNGIPFSLAIEFSIYQSKRRSSWSVFCPRTELVAEIEFTEWTPDGHLRHSKFVGLREDKEARDVVREIEG